MNTLTAVLLTQHLHSLVILFFDIFFIVLLKNSSLTGNNVIKDKLSPLSVYVASYPELNNCSHGTIRSV